jgi:hypothetical protein
MDKGNNKENQFSNDLDRLITGERLKTEETVDKDYEGVVQFAKKMVDSRIEPTPDFKESLRKKLLSKAVEQEMETERERESGNNFWKKAMNFIPHSPAWRTVTATIAVFVVAFVIVWSLGIFSGPTNPPILGTTPPTGNVPQGLVEVTATTSKSTYMVGETIDIVFLFKNTSEETVTLATFPPEIIIAASSLKPYKMISGGAAKTLAPAETVEYSITWDQLDNEGLQVPAGDYIINILDIELDGGKGVVTFSDSPRITIIAP